MVSPSITLLAMSGSLPQTTITKSPPVDEYKEPAILQTPNQSTGNPKLSTIDYFYKIDYEMDLTHSEEQMIIRTTSKPSSSMPVLSELISESSAVFPYIKNATKFNNKNVKAELILTSELNNIITKVTATTQKSSVVSTKGSLKSNLGDLQQGSKVNDFVDETTVPQSLQGHENVVGKEFPQQYGEYLQLFLFIACKSELL